MNKNILKQNYYYEFKPFFDGLPEDLPVPENPKEVKNDRVMNEKEMAEGHEFFSKEEAFGLACKNKKEGKDSLIWFKDDSGELCYVLVYNGGSSVYVRPFYAAYKWREGRLSFFRNDTLKSLNLETFDP